VQLVSSLRRAAASFPNKSGIILGRRTVTYSELDHEARHLALKLVACGVRPGDRVALHLYNGPDLAISYFACFYAGAIAVPINTRMKAPEIEYVLKHSGSSMYLGQPELFREIEDIRLRFPCIRHFAVGTSELDAASQGLAAVRLPDVGPDQPALILYTSGSTARPKGVLHTQRSLWNAAQGFCIEETDVVLLITPMVHVAAFLEMIAITEAVATAIVVPQFEPDAVLDAIAYHRTTYLFGMPAMYRALIAAQKAQPRDVSSGKRYLAAGDAVPPALQTEFAQCFGRPLHEGFGTTETGVTAINWSCAEARTGSFGRAAPGVEIRVVDDDGNSVPAEVPGEMIVRSHGNLVGYWDDQTATEKAIRGGWFHTGDIVHEDGDGYFWFLGRKKEIIVHGGSNVSPQEVEAVLYQHAAVRDAGVVGAPDEFWGERVVAFVSRRSGHKVTRGELIAFVAQRLAAYKIPEQVVFLHELPKNAVGKVSRRALRETYVLNRAAEELLPETA
jgi:long-chain acyl-CoA synthetase